MSNYGAGGLITGDPGSIRTPVILASSVVTVPASGGAVKFTASRYYNEGPGPVFLERISVSLGAASGSYALAVTTQTSLRLSLGGWKTSLSAVPAPIFTENSLTVIGGNAAISTWRFRKPFMLKPGQSCDIEAVTSYSAGVTATVALIGYRESRPAKQRAVYVPSIIAGQTLIAAAGGIGNIPEESLRNDGDYDFIATDFAMLSTLVSDGSLLTVNQNKLRLTATDAEIMLDRVTQGTLMPIYRTDLNILLTSPVPFGHGFRLPPGGAFACEVEGSAQSAQTKIDLAILGYREVPLEA